jgi:hypothetical protein
MGAIYILLVLYSQKTLLSQQLLNLDLEFLQFWKYIDEHFTNLKAFKFYSINLAIDFMRQPNYLMGEIPSLHGNSINNTQ